jgi:signal transduction histidine kinase
MDTLNLGWNRLRRIIAANPDSVFTGVAIGLTIAAVATIPDAEPGSGFKDPDGLATALVVLQTAVIAFVRRWPVAVITVLVAALIAEASLEYLLGDVAFLASLVAVFVVASRTVGWRAVYGAAATGVALIVLFLVEGGGITTISELLINIAIFAVAWVGGMLVRSRMTRLTQAENYAAELTAQRDLAAQAAVAGERSRIARELHDAVGHTLNLIVVQAGAAKRVRESNPTAAFAALDSIENTGRQALADMDRMLGILRDHPDSEAEGLGPRPGLGRLEPMLNEARSAGVRVEVEIVGEARRLPVSIDLTAYRIIQEAITNVMKHAPGAEAAVQLDYAPRTLGLNITNGPPRSGHVRPASGGGRGLPGMQERVALFGGSIKYGRAGDGFQVQVSLHIGEAS